MSKSLRFSKNLATSYAVLIVTLETIRRKDQLLQPEHFFLWFDEYMMGGFMLFAAWKAHRNMTEGQHYLAAAWGIAVGALFLSFRGQLGRASDPAPFVSSAGVAIGKGVFFLLAIVGLICSLQRIKGKQNDRPTL